MNRRELQRRNHPKKGSSIKVEPIRSLHAIQQIKSNLLGSPRDFCLFTTGINTAYRANELLSLRIAKIQHLRVGDRLDLKQSKNKKYRATTLNRTVIAAMHAWLADHPCPYPDKPLFISQRTGEALSVSEVSRLAKKWCEGAGLPGNYASHSLRKTWGFQQRMNGVSVAVLMKSFGHSSEKQTLEYLCIQEEEIRQLYALEL